LEERWSAALQAIRSGKPIAILDDANREGETDLYLPAYNVEGEGIRYIRREGRGELYMSVGREVAAQFALPYMANALKSAARDFPALRGLMKAEEKMCQGSCSVSLSFDHRSTHTGASDHEIAVTCSEFARLYQRCRQENLQEEQSIEQLGLAFHTPGHIFTCVERSAGLVERQGHTELSVAVARAAGVTPVMVGTVVLNKEGENYGAASVEDAYAWATQKQVPYLTGHEICQLVIGL